MNRTDETERGWGGAWGWVVVLGIGAAIVLWGILQYAVVRDVPRDWSYGTEPETPAMSVYSTVEPRRTGTTPEQIAPLPEAVPLGKQGDRR